MPTDRRVRAKYKHNDLRLDEDTMTATVMGPDGAIGEVPFEYTTCPTCRGKGTHVDPAIDSGGLDPATMEPKFRRDYFGGTYDQPCNECEGRRVVPVLQPKTTEHEDVLEKRRSLKEQARHSRETQRQERRMALGRIR
jgi:RecJ-like exonuclease